MQTIDVIYTGGKFEPLGAVGLAENQQVRLTIDTKATAAPAEPEWLVGLRVHQASMKAKYGNLPDSTAIIREYRDKQ